MIKIWYLLKCPEGTEADYTEKRKRITSQDGLQEIIFFQYQRMMRYKGQWHLEKRALLPGWIFVLGTEMLDLESSFPLNERELLFLKNLCQTGNLVGISRGVVKDGVPMVTSGPLMGHEQLIRKIDRHKRTADIEIPFAGHVRQVTVGLEIYQKE